MGPCRFQSEEEAEGAVPSRPTTVSAHNEDSDSAYHSLEEATDSDGACPSKNVASQTESDPITVEFHAIARDILNAEYPLDRTLQPPRFQSPFTETVVRLVREILDKHEAVFNSIVKLIQKSDVEKCPACLTVMCDELFKADVVTWGRVLALFALVYHMARCYNQNGEDRRIAQTISDFVGRYVGEKATKWVREEGGWKSLELAFPAKDAMEKKVWKSLLVTGLGLGFLATMIKVVR